MAIRQKNPDHDDDNLAHFLTRLSWKGRIYFASLLLVFLGGGINLARIGAVRELFQITVDPKTEVKEIRIPATRNEELDRKIQGWVEANEKRIAELHTELMKVEEEARYWSGYTEKQQAYAALATRLKDSIAKENEAFARNLATLKEGAE